MKTAISEAVDAWIREEDLAVSPTLKVVRRFDGVYPEGEEAEAYWDFMSWYFQQDYVPLLGLGSDEEVVWPD